MKNYLFVFLILTGFACTQHHPDNDTDTVIATEPSAEELLEKWGADEWGMKSYVMAFLKSGPNRDQDSTEAANLQKAHLENIGRMADSGELIIAGPFLDDGEIRGIYIFNVATVEEARELTATDPAIQAGRLEMELHPWYGSAALMELPELYKKAEKKDPGSD